MKTGMEQLQADMMTSGVFTRHERRQMKYLTKANEAQRQYVRAALPANHLARRWMDTCGEVDGWSNIDYCGVPLCPRCHMRERAVQTGKAIKKIFCDAANDELAFATILLPPQLDFSGMTDLMENEKRRLRTFIDRQRRKDNRWNDFELLGWWEIDRMRFGDFESCGRNTRLALDAMGFPLLEVPDKTIWRPHLHAIVRKGRLTTHEIASALRKETHTAKYQVDLQPFRAYRDVRENIQSIVRYCLKFRIECDYKAPDAQDFVEQEQAGAAMPIERNWWPAEDIRQYVDWLCIKRSGFQSLRVVLGRAKGKSTDELQSAMSRAILIPEEVGDGNASVKSLSDRVCNQRVIEELDDDVVKGPVIQGNITSVYNNSVQDTNWTGLKSLERLMPPPAHGTSQTYCSQRASIRPIKSGDVIKLLQQIKSEQMFPSTNDFRAGEVSS